MRSIQSQRIINMAIKQNNNLTNGVRTGYSDLQTNKYGFYGCVGPWVFIKRSKKY